MKNALSYCIIAQATGRTDEAVHEPDYLLVLVLLPGLSQGSQQEISLALQQDNIAMTMLHICQRIVQDIALCSVNYVWWEIKGTFPGIRVEQRGYPVARLNPCSRLGCNGGREVITRHKHKQGNTHELPQSCCRTPQPRQIYKRVLSW